MANSLLAVVLGVRCSRSTYEGEWINITAFFVAYLLFYIAH